jgi:hypothetical protein
MVVENLIEARQAHTRRLFIIVIANRRSAPDTLDHKRLLFFFLYLIHALHDTRRTLNTG